jgi:hypothetical protein
MESNTNITTPITIGCFQPGSGSMIDPFIKDGEIIRDTGKARLIKGTIVTPNDDGDKVKFWLPNFFIKTIISVTSGTTFILTTGRRMDIEDRMEPFKE